MKADAPPTNRSTLTGRLSSFSLGLAIVWTLVVGASFSWNWVLQEDKLAEVAKASARASIEKDVLYLMWNSRFGGVDAKTEMKGANELLPEGQPASEVSTEDVPPLTLVTPAKMARHVQNVDVSFGVKNGHLASLTPLNGKNVPDLWEEDALREFGRGADEVSSIEIFNNSEFLRLMRPLILEKECLSCHALQGYQLGEVRGGISQRVPMSPLREAVAHSTNVMGAGHAVLWVLGLSGIAFGRGRLAAQIEKRERAEARVRHLANHDDLTGLPNRRLLMDRLRRSIARSRRSGLRTGLLFIDLDELKPINDQLGHEAGDTVLKEVASRLSDCIRETDTIARLGGDEFTIVLSDLPNIESVARVANEALEVLNVPMKLPQDKVSTGASIGIAFFPDDADSAEDLLKAADVAMYEVKSLGKNGFSFADSGRMDLIPINLEEKRARI